jgi:hypothetical protein
MRAQWRPQVRNGTFVDITGARKPEWLAENMSNPLREWDGRPHISGSRFAKATAQYKATRRAIMAELSAEGEPAESRMAHIGREYAALDLIIGDAEATTGKDLTAVKQTLIHGVEEARSW